MYVCSFGWLDGWMDESMSKQLAWSWSWIFTRSLLVRSSSSPASPNEKKTQIQSSFKPINLSLMSPQIFNHQVNITKKNQLLIRSYRQKALLQIMNAILEEFQQLQRTCMRASGAPLYPHAKGFSLSILLRKWAKYRHHSTIHLATINLVNIMNSASQLVI